MFKIIVFAIMAVMYATDIVDVSSTGESMHEPIDDVSPLRRVKIENNYENQTISVFWHNPDNQNGVHMFDLEPLEYLGVNSMEGHIFYATVVNDEFHRVSPNSISIRKDLDTYGFGPIVPESTRDRLHPSVKIMNQRTTAVVPKFRCLIPAGADFYCAEEGGDEFLGTWPLGREQTMNAYEGQIFFFTAKGNKSLEYARFTLTKDRALYFAYDETDPAPPAMLEHVAKEEAFGKEYLERTGIMWQHYFGPDGPRPPPMLFMWTADNVGDVHKVTTQHGYWSCDGTAEECQQAEPLHLELEVVSSQPRAFIIEDFLNAFEAETIIKYAQPKVEDSTIGQRDGTEQKSDTRTSRNAWVQRKTSSLIDSLYRRAADLLQLDESILYSHKSCESFQVVHYDIGQRYAAHHDWSVAGYPQSRFLTLLLYLTDMVDPEAGGETSFPKAMDGLGFKVAPKKGQAVLFYNMLEDGNGADQSLHAALPVKRGEKWLANLWVWDPSRRP